jgi:ribbon-helix-helix protein
MPRPKRVDAVQVPFNLPRSDALALKKLSEKTHVPQQWYIRRAITDLLAKYAQEVRT